jgi:hypothetical protein
MRITVKGLAQFMAAGPARQRQILRDFKYPDPKGRAKALYYAESRQAVRRFHSDGGSLGILLGAIARLSRRAAQNSGHASRRLGDNCSALVQYATHFAEQGYIVLPDRDLRLEYGPLTVSCAPDLCVLERGRERFVKMEFSKPIPSDRTVAVITQALFGAACRSGCEAAPGDVFYVDVRRGAVHRVARLRSRVARDIEAACETIADIWPSL